MLKKSTEWPGTISAQIKNANELGNASCFTEPSFFFYFVLVFDVLNVTIFGFTISEREGFSGSRSKSTHGKPA